jgi:S-adenosylmethionine:tRNA ribosyltransferase-isomerase
MHGEHFVVPSQTAEAIDRCKGRIIAVGTTTVRALESAAVGPRKLNAGSGTTKIFVVPGYQFQIVDAMVTNFHMPRTTMLLMVAAMCGVETLKRSYETALAEGYRFLSFGDGMLIISRSTNEKR